MDLAAAITRMRAAGTVLSVEEGRLVVQTEIPLSEPQRAFLQAHRAELIGLLSATVCATVWEVRDSRGLCHCTWPEPVTEPQARAEYPDGSSSP